jgi:hypothetical protein
MWLSETYDMSFNTPTKCTYTVKYMYQLSPLLLHVLALFATSSGRTFFGILEILVIFCEYIGFIQFKKTYLSEVPH